MSAFSSPTATWFAEQFPGPTEVQRRGWEAIADGAHALLIAPTGSGKTLAAFLWAIDRLTQLPADAETGVRVLYVSPLKALVYDIERNLRSPLAGVARTSERLGLAARAIRVDVRTGDTPQRERQRQARSPGEILVTTPESLYLILGSKARAGLATVETVIVDEIHALAPTKRGAHLALSLERLAELCARDPQRVGLSATVRPAEEVAAFLGGDRPVRVVDASAPPALDLAVRVPVPDMENVPPPADREGDGESGSVLGLLYKHQVGAPMRERGVWTAMYPELVREIRAHRSTILFVNSRGLCERLAQRLNALAGEELVLAHHGSVSHEKRAAIEDGLKRGRLRAIVATSSLELGIDMGAVDLVLQIESPGAVARGLQRVGRAGHRVGETSVGRIYPKFRGDLLEAAVVAGEMLRGAIEPLRVPRNPLDVLAQQVVAACCDRERSVEELERLVRRAHPYRELTRPALVAVLDMLSGRYPGGELADLRPRLRWDRTADVLSARRGTALVARLNAGTIPDRGSYGVHLGPDGPRIGELDEEMVFESRDGDTFLLGSSTWRVEEITRGRVIVSPAPGEPGRLPFWKGEGPGRPVELGRALGAFVRELGAREPTDAEHWVRERLPLDEHAAANLVAYVREQREVTGTLPTDRAITVERFRDELGDWRVCILSPFGSRLHAPWAHAIEERLATRTGIEAQVVYTDDGIVLRLADTEELPDLQLLLPEPEEVADLVTARLGRSALFAALFRENAVRSLLVARRRPDQRSPLWAQRLKTRELLAAVERYPDFPIVLETYRQALADVFDVRGLEELLAAIRRREVAVEEVETRSPSPFARSLVFAYVGAFLYDGDAPVAERRAQALTLDKGLLRELLGQAELRELLDADVLSELEAELSGSADTRRARDRDELADLLRRVGDLSRTELAERCEGDPAAWLSALFDEGRALEVALAGERRWIAADDAGLYRDALGCHVPGGLPGEFLEPVERSLERLVRRFARGRGPFLTRDLAARYALAPGQVEPALRLLEADGVLVRGELRPGGSEPEWCDAEVLRALKRRTLAKLRREVAPVDAAALARFLPRWHGLGETRGERDRLGAALDRLQGLALPWSALALELLPARVPGFALDALDLECASGRVVWVGRGALGPRDGRVALYRRERVAELLELEAGWEPPSPLHAALLAHLEQRGASFLTELERAARAAQPGLGARDVEGALWDLVWAGRVTNDTFQPLRSLGRRATRARGAWRSSPAGGRWSRVEDLLEPRADTERTLARAGVLLERYGVVSREAAAAEELTGGFGPLYRVLKAMEEAGRIRRGWFVEGLSGAQFALPGAVDRLRARREGASEPEVVALPAVDPANAWGALLPWPERADDARPRRVPGAWVGLVDGELAWYLLPGRRRLLLFERVLDDRRERLTLALRALHALPRSGRRLLVLDRVDDLDAQDSPHLQAFLDAGFVPDYRGLIADPGRGERAAGRTLGGA